jgi:hypothetical protein
MNSIREEGNRGTIAVAGHAYPPLSRLFRSDVLLPQLQSPFQNNS